MDGDGGVDDGCLGDDERSEVEEDDERRVVKRGIVMVGIMEGGGEIKEGLEW